MREAGNPKEEDQNNKRYDELLYLILLYEVSMSF